MSCDLMTKCRTCLCDSHIFHQLNDYVDENYKILEMLDGIVPQIDIKTLSNYSTLVCQSCVDKLVAGYKFQQLCIETNKRLHDLMGFSIFETVPLTGEASFKMKIEFENEAFFECELNPEKLEKSSGKDSDWVPGHNTDNDTDSSNEKLSVLKERITQKSSSKSDEGERPSKNDRRRGQFPCSECGKVFDRLYRLKRHAAVHAKMGPYRCEICKYSYAAENTFKAHMLMHENEDITKSNIEVNNESKEENDIVKDTQTFQCPDCPKCFDQKAYLSAHYKVHTKKTKNKSNEDDVDEDDSDDDSKKNAFTEPGAKHIKNMDLIDTGMGEIEKPYSSNKKSGNFPCEVCGKVFYHAYNLKRHSSVHSFTKPHECKICNYRFDRVYNLKAHMVQHDRILTQSRPEGFKCPDCPRRFEKETSLSVHRQIHTRKANYPCMVCQRNFMSVGFLTKHIINKHPEVEKHKCDQCDKTFLLHDHLMEHLNRHKANKNRVCLICEKEFGKTKFLKEHMRTHNSSETNYPCMVCERNFMSVRFLTEHITNKHPEVEKHKCDQCDKIFVLHDHLMEHLNRHKANKNRVCLICEKEFGNTKFLKEHMRTHRVKSSYLCPCPNSAEANYPCMVCQRNFMSGRSLTEHITNEHPEVEKHKCDQCDETFVLHDHLVEHLNSHKGNKNLVCLICEKVLGNKYTLKEHMLAHSGESRYLCPQCGNTFRSAGSLREHMDRHRDLKKYQCPKCPLRFNCRSDLRKHSSTHTNAKPHVCDVCGSRFTQKATLRKHKVLHSGERPFKCDQCSMKFLMIYQLRSHKRTHTGEKPHKCKYCKRAYTKGGDLTRHLRTHVGEYTYMCDQCPMAFKKQPELKQHQSEHIKMAQKLAQHHQQLPLPTNNHNQQIIIADQNQQLTIAIPNHQQMALVDHHSQQLPTIVEQTQQLSDMNEVARLDNIDINNLPS